MPRVLVVESPSKTSRQLASRLREANYLTEFVPDAPAAIERLNAELFDVVLTAMNPPEVNSVGLIDFVRERHPRVPVVVLVDPGAETAASEAVRRGAVSYLFRRRIDQDLCPLLSHLLGLTGRRRSKKVPDCWAESTSRFVLGNDVELVPAFVAHVSDSLRLIHFEDEDVRIRVAVALTEAVTNAILHGNLELSSELREGDGSEWDRECRLRRSSAPYQDRRVVVDCLLNRERVEFRVRDEGPGFDPKAVPDPRRPEGLDRISGRGVLLMRTFMHEVQFNKRGNEVTLVRRAAE